ncbi:MAG: hypothetical protein KJ626_09475 [Verrucomicrobia bacterium]|nr:hypothetical protein [Verrucomicrobiota bacterium]
MKTCGSVKVREYGSGPTPTPPYSHTPILLLCLTLLVSACSQTNAPSGASQHVTASLSTNTIHIGDEVIATLSVIHPAGTHVQLDEPGRGKAIIVRDRKWDSSELNPTQLISRATYTLTSLEIGDHSVSTGRVQIVSEEGDAVSAPYPDIQLHVVSALESEDTQPHDIKDLAVWPRRFPRWIGVLIGIALAALAIALLVGRFLSKPRTIIHEPPPIPAHEKALRALMLLKEKGWIEALNIEPFYVALSDVVRHYIEDRFRLHAPERTTEEFIREAAANSDLNTDHRMLVSDFLTQSDLVKFAKYQPEQRDMQSAFDSAERLIHETTSSVPPDSHTPTHGERGRQT